MKEGWEMKQWAEVLEIRSGRNQKEVLNPNGKYPILGSAGKIMGYADDYICEEGTTIIGRKGTINSPLFITQKFWNVDTAFGLHSMDELDKNYLHYFCLSFDFTEMDRGSGRPSLVKSDLLKIQIPIPPLPEQKQIVAILDKAFAAIDQAQANIEKNIENAKELFQSKLNDIFSQKGDGWEEKSLGEIIDITHGYAFKSKDFKTDFKGGNPIVLTPGNFDEDSTLYFTQKNTKRLIGEYQKEYLFDIGDLVVVMTDLSSKMKILGKPAIIDSDNILHNQRIGRVVFKKDGIETEFLYYYFQTEKYLNNIKESATGTMVKHTAPKRIVENQISYPKSIDMQKKMIETINNLKSETEAIESRYHQKLANLEEFKKSILQKAFSGELTQEATSAKMAQVQ